VISQGDQASNTEAEAEKAAKHYLDAVEKQYQTTDPSSFTYGGIQKIDVDGAIQQVTWNVSDDGFATTRASRNREELLVVPSYNERRMMERLQDALTLQNLTTRTRKEAMERGKA